MPVQVAKEYSSPFCVDGVATVRRPGNSRRIHGPASSWSEIA